LKILVPVSQFHLGNTSEYVVRALLQMGHEARIVTVPEFYQALLADTHDLYLCVDSGEPISFFDPQISEVALKKVAFWFIDYRHNKDRETRKPTDRETVLELSRRGGFVFQSQSEDQEEMVSLEISKSAWLPLAADPEIWRDSPTDSQIEEKLYDIGFVGNVWDQGRAEILQTLLQVRGIKVGFPGATIKERVWKEDAAKILRQSLVGFNVNSWFGTAQAYDVNMRVYETLSCGVPILTNEVPQLKKIFPENAPYLRTYHDSQSLIRALPEIFNDQEFLHSGGLAREAILNGHTYIHRMKDLLDKYLRPQAADSL
jgi:spore maturation protein CgeB